MTESTELQTKRLLLRPYRLTDVDDVLAYANDEDWQRFLPVPYPYERVHAEQFVARAFIADWSSRPVFEITFEGTVIGGINLRIMSDRNVAEMGYSVAKAHWSKGIATESARAVIKWGFEACSLAKIVATANIDNERSWHVMERVGMTREGVLRSGRPHEHDPELRTDSVYYGILRGEWER
jgi:ribosomal-protein-alanine N-acetyltransferase